MVSMMFQRMFVLAPANKVANNVVTCLVRCLALLHVHVGSDIIWLCLLKRIMTTFLRYTCYLNFMQYHLNTLSMLGSCSSILFVCSFCCFTSQVNSYGHGGTVSSPNHTFSWASLKKQLTSTSCTYFRL